MWVTMNIFYHWLLCLERRMASKRRNFCCCLTSVLHIIMKVLNWSIFETCIYPKYHKLHAASVATS